MSKKNIRILVDAHKFDHITQGTTTYIKGVYGEFIKKYKDIYDISFMAHNLQKLEKEFPDVKPTQLIKLEKDSSRYRLTNGIYNIIKKNKIDFAHFQQIAPLFKACAYITTVHDLLFNDFPDKFSFAYRKSRNFLFKRSLSLSEIKLTVSEYSKQSIEKYYGMKNVGITPNAVSSIFFQDYDKNVSVDYIRKKFGIENYILFVSRIEERKNHAMLLKAFKELKLSQQKIALVFIGKNDIPVNSLNTEIESLSPQERESFHWLQQINDQDLMEFYKAARLFVYPSLAEGFGIPPIEACALKINTLCSNVTAMSDFSFFEENHFDPYNYEAFVKLLNQNIINPAPGNTLTKRSDIVREKYSWGNAADTIHHLIQDELLKRKN